MPEPESTPSDATAAPPADVTGEVDVNLQTSIEKLDSMVDGGVRLLPNLAIGLVVFVVFLVLAWLARKLIVRLTESSEKQNLGLVGGRLAQILLIGLGLMTALTIIIPTLTAGKAFASLGVSGVVLGFAFKDILQNFMAGVLLLLREPFSIGDQIQYKDFEGTVTGIETRSTFIKTYDGRRVVIPNGEIYTNAVVVNTAFDTRRSQYDVGIGYGDDIDAAIDVVVAAMKGVEGVVSDPAPEAFVMELAGFSVNLRLRWRTASEQKDVIHIHGRVLKAVKYALDDAAIDMPLPTQMLLLHDQTEAVDGDRTRQREGWPAGDNPPAPRRRGDEARPADPNSASTPTATEPRDPHGDPT